MDAEASRCHRVIARHKKMSHRPSSSSLGSTTVPKLWRGLTKIILTQLRSPDDVDTQPIEELTLNADEMSLGQG